MKFFKIILIVKVIVAILALCVLGYVVFTACGAVS